ncbi:MAG TPA: DUF1279 domain-containing protein [Myxococcaceae bacterium]|jgi:hypothetical protein
MEPVDPRVKPTSTDTPPPQAPAKPSVKERFSVLMKEYGFVAICVYLSTSLVSMVVFTLVITAGLGDALAQRYNVDLSGGGGLGATLFAAWLMTKAIQIPRIFATLALTPVVARIPPVARALQRARESKD